MLQDLLNSKSKNDGPNDHEDLKKKREEFSMEIRRDSRQQLFQKKRSNIAMNVDMPISEKGLQSQTNTTVVTPEVNQALKEFIEVCVNRTYTMDDFNNLVKNKRKLNKSLYYFE